MTEQAELHRAIAVLEAQRSILGDAVVDGAIAPIREQIRVQEESQQQAGVTLPEERKLITILFADVVGSTAMAEQLGGETARLILDRCLRRVSEAVDKFGGTVSLLMGDGLMAFFGVPRAFEDDPERAVLASLRIHENIAAYARELGQPIQVRVGVNTGRVVLGEIGGDAYSEFTAMGPPVNLAARLQSAAAPGKTLLGESTARMVRYRFQVDPVEPLQLKGFEDPVKAFELVGIQAQPAQPRGIPGLQSPLVGRDHELGELVQMVGGLEQGIGGIAALIGEPGIGKSRLLQETKSANQGISVRFAEGRAYSYTQDQPFSLVLDLLAELLDLAADDSPAIMDLKLEAALSPLFEGELEKVWPFLATLLGAPVPPQYAPALAGLDPEAINAKIIQAVQMLVERLAAQRSLVLSFEDLHWADRASLKLIESLLLDTEQFPMLLILLFRPDRDKPAWQLKITAETHFAHRYLEQPLAPLDEQASTEMVKNLLAATNFPGELQETIREKAQGNPLYVEELIRSLIEGDVLVREGDSWEMQGGMTALEVPETLEKVIQARVDRLQPAVRASLQAASVIGRRFSYHVLAGVIGADDDLRNQLLYLQQGGMVREYSRLPELEYIFKHGLVQTVVYKTLLKAQRRQLHRQTAETLEKLFPERRDDLAGTLAQHYAAAGDRSKAITLFVQAAGQAEEIYAYEEAIHFLQRARELSDLETGEPKERLTLLEKLGDMHYLVRESVKAISIYDKLLALHETQAHADKWATIRLKRKICAAWRSLTYVDARRLEPQVQTHLLIALRLIDGEQPHLETVRLLTAASRCMWVIQNPDQDFRSMSHYARAAVDMAEQLDAPVELSAALDALGSDYYRMGRFRDLLHLQQRRQQLSRDPRFDDIREKLNILIETAEALKMMGDYAQAMPLLLEAEALGKQIKDIYNQANALWLQAECWVRLDQWDEVLSAQDKIKILQARYPLKRIGPVCWLLGFSASIYALRGEEKIAAQLADESYEIMTGFRGGEEDWHPPQYF